MASMTRKSEIERQAWLAPGLQYRGTVGDLLRTGGGKLSIAGADPGEMRCEKPHEEQCLAAEAGGA